MPLQRGGRTVGPGDHRQVAIALVVEMLRHPRRADVVGAGHAGELLARLRRTVEIDHRNAVGPALLGQLGRQAGRHQQQRIHPELQQGIDQLVGVPLPPGGEHQQVQPLLGKADRQGVERFEIEGVARVAHHHADDARLAGDQRAGVQVGPVAELLGRLEHLVAGQLGDARPRRIGARDRRLRNPGQARDIVCGRKRQSPCHLPHWTHEPYRKAPLPHPPDLPQERAAGQPFPVYPSTAPPPSPDRSRGPVDGPGFR